MASLHLRASAISGRALARREMTRPRQSSTVAVRAACHLHDCASTSHMPARTTEPWARPRLCRQLEHGCRRFCDVIDEFDEELGEFVPSFLGRLGKRRGCRTLHACHIFQPNARYSTRRIHPASSPGAAFARRTTRPRSGSLAVPAPGAPSIRSIAFILSLRCTPL